MINEMSSVLHEMELHERQALLRDRARRDLAGITTGRDRRRLFRRVVRHSS
jgi:hypothetical protein